MGKKNFFVVFLCLMLFVFLFSSSPISPVLGQDEFLISGVVRDQPGNPIADVFIVAHDPSSAMDVSSTYSDANGDYSLLVPAGSYSLFVTPPPESGFSETTIPSLDVFSDIIVVIVLVTLGSFTFRGHIYDRDDNPISNQLVALSTYYDYFSGSTDSTGFFSINAPPNFYNINIYADPAYLDPNLPPYWGVYSSSDRSFELNQDTVKDFIIQNRYIDGLVTDPSGNIVPNTNILVRGQTSFDGLVGWYESYASTNEFGFYSLVVLNGTAELTATPPANEPFGPVKLEGINIQQDGSINVELIPILNFSGHVYDRDGNPIANQQVALSTYFDYFSGFTDSEGFFSIYAPSGFYNIHINADPAYLEPNVPPYWGVYSSGDLNFELSQDTVKDFMIQNRYITGEVTDPSNTPVPNVNILIRGQTSFDGLIGWYESYASTDEFGFYSLVVLNGTAELSATPSPNDPWGPVKLSDIDIQQDMTINVQLVSTVNFFGHVYDRDGNPIANQQVALATYYDYFSGFTDSEGFFSIYAPAGLYNIHINADPAYLEPNVPPYWGVYSSGDLSFELSRNTEKDFVIQNRYITGQVIDPEGNGIPNVHVMVRGSTAFDGFVGWYDSYITSDNQGNFNFVVLNGTGSLTATPDPGSPYIPIFINDIDFSVDKSLKILLTDNEEPPEPVIATVDIDPDTLNLKSNGQWITAYIELPESFNPFDIILETIELEIDTQVFSIAIDAPFTIGDYDNDGTPDLMVKFDRSEVISFLGLSDYDYTSDPGENVLIRFAVTGMIGGDQFLGVDWITVIYRGK
jgi:protocatechuate 3,4-dioxygenase beta subunit